MGCCLEKPFSSKGSNWKVTQDMPAVGNKIHRPNPEMRCLAVFVNGEVCVEIQGLEHLFFRGFMNV